MGSFIMDLIDVFDTLEMGQIKALTTFSLKLNFFSIKWLIFSLSVSFSSYVIDLSLSTIPSVRK
jgi:hypothetical protein